MFNFLDGYSVSGHVSRFCLYTGIILLLFSGSSCSSLRKGQRGIPQDVPPGFYQHHSQLLGYRLIGREDPRLIEAVSSWMGVPYRFGGTTRQGADCSGFVLNIYEQVYAITLPRSTDAMAAEARKVRKQNLQEGDLVFFRINKGRKVSHVGIYLSNNKFIHTSTSRGVIVSDLNETYYATRFVQGGRMR